jgi:hypothetical protein
LRIADCGLKTIDADGSASGGFRLALNRGVGNGMNSVLPVRVFFDYRKTLGFMNFDDLRAGGPAFQPLFRGARCSGEGVY